MNYVLAIEGVVVDPLWGSFHLSMVANGVDTLVCDIPSDDGSYRPDLDDWVTCVENCGTSATSETVSVGTKVFTTQSGLGFQAGERVRVARVSVPANWMEGFITSYVGTALTVAVDFIYGGGNSDSNWDIGRRVFGGLVMKASESGLGGVGLTPIVTRIECMDYNQLPDRRVVNETIASGTLKAALQVLYTYVSAYGATLDPNQVDGPTLSELVFDRVGLREAFDQLSTLTGYIWEIDSYGYLRMFAPGTIAAPFNITAGDDNVLGDVTVEPTRESYVNRVFVLYDKGEQIVQADDVAEQGDHGLWEVILRQDELTSETSAQDLADTYLLQHVPTPKVVHYTTRTPGLTVGRTQTINLPLRHINANCLVTEVDMSDGEDPDRFDRRVTALEGSIYQLGWRNVYQKWSGSVTGTVIGGMGGGVGGRRVYWLGGSSIEYVQSPGPDWVPSTMGPQGSEGAVRVLLDTVALGRTTFTVYLRMRARAGTVTARLRNVSDGVTVGTSAAVGTTTWTSVSFSVTLTAGAKYYELQLLPSLADTDVAAVGYLE